MPPILMMLGGQDKTTSLKSANKIFHSFSQNDKNKIEYDDLDHYMLADGEWNDIITRDICSWMEMHM